MIIAVDFDGTLMVGNEPNTVLIRQLISEQKRGNVVILWTCREGESLQEALRFLCRFGLVPNAVNQNVPQVISRIGRNPRKIFADVYIDDKNMPPCTFLQKTGSTT